MRSSRKAYKLTVVISYLCVAVIYLIVFLPLYLIKFHSLLLQAVHVIDLFVCIGAGVYLYKIRRIELPSIALCIIAYLTVVSVMVTGGYFNAGPFLVFPYVPFVTFLSRNAKESFLWLSGMLITMCLILALGLLSSITLPFKSTTFALYIFMYLITILLLSSYVKEKELSDIEVNQKTTQLNSKNKKLKQLNESKDNFIRLASHQLRTPATGVKQYLGMLLQGFSGDMTEEQFSFVSKAYESNERQIKIVNDLLLIAQVDEGKITLNKHLTNLSSLIKDVVMEQASSLKKRRQRVVQIYPDPLPPVNVDAGKLRMIIENLIDNASKYSLHGMLIEVKITVRENTFSVSVSDQGVGISAKDRPKLFKKFSRIDNSLSTMVGGSGLGLYWVKKVTDLHGGKILVRSSVGKGTTFELILPR